MIFGLDITCGWRFCVAGLRSAVACLCGLHAACGNRECIECHGNCSMVCKSLGGAHHNTLALCSMRVRRF